MQTDALLPGSDRSVTFRETVYVRTIPATPDHPADHSDDPANPNDDLAYTTDGRASPNLFSETGLPAFSRERLAGRSALKKKTLARKTKGFSRLIRKRPGSVNPLFLADYINTLFKKICRARGIENRKFSKLAIAYLTILINRVRDALIATVYEVGSRAVGTTCVDAALRLLINSKAPLPWNTNLYTHHYNDNDPFATDEEMSDVDGEYSSAGEDASDSSRADGKHGPEASSSADGDGYANETILSRVIRESDEAAERYTRSLVIVDDAK